MNATDPHAEAARTIHERWLGYVREARETLGADAALDRILHRAIAEWRQREPPELAFVADELSAERRETRHETVEDTLLSRVERGELIALRRADGDVRYLTPEERARFTPEEHAEWLPYDPLLARAIRRHQLDEFPL